MGIGILLDMLILFGFVGGILLNLRRGFIRALVGLFMLFLAMTFAALLYNPIIYWFSSVMEKPGSGRTGGAFVFAGLLIVFYAVLEVIVSRNYPQLRLRRLGVVDNILGVIVGLVWSLLAISLVLIVMDFASITIGADLAFITELLRTSLLTKVFRAFFQIPLAPIRLLFPGGLPEVLQHFTR